VRRWSSLGRTLVSFVTQAQPYREIDVDIGDIIDGKYRIVRRLGEGGMGTVYEVIHEFLGARFALKTLHPQLATNKSIVRRFVQEAKAASAIGSEHIVKVTDAGQARDGSPYLVMEYLDGEELSIVLKRERGSWSPRGPLG
jgi:eukaryotic-like serine/threonine-protein kinase